jgi:hypothetical protein
LKVRQQRTEARQRAIEAKRERREETRRKILLGGVVLGKLADGDPTARAIREWLDQSLRRDADRALFGLPVLSTVEGAARGGQ